MFYRFSCLFSKTLVKPNYVSTWQEVMAAATSNALNIIPSSILFGWHNDYSIRYFDSIVSFPWTFLVQILFDSGHMFLFHHVWQLSNGFHAIARLMWLQFPFEHFVLFFSCALFVFLMMSSVCLCTLLMSQFFGPEIKTDRSIDVAANVLVFWYFNLT